MRNSSSSSGGAITVVTVYYYHRVSLTWFSVHCLRKNYITDIIYRYKNMCLTIIGQNLAFNTEPWLTWNSKLIRAQNKTTSVKQFKHENQRSNIY